MSHSTESNVNVETLVTAPTVGPIPKTTNAPGDRQQITLFAAPKAFVGDTGIIQRNAIASWNQLRPNVEILLFGDDDGIEEIAKEFGIRHFPDIRRNDSGTPLLDSIFEQAIDAASTPLLMYTNSDILFDSSLLKTVAALRQLELESFLAIGQRTDFDQKELLSFEDPQCQRDLKSKLNEKGRLASILCKDYFIFHGETYRGIPAFSIGRGNWDNWMVSRAAQSNSPVIDVTHELTAGHQNHDYDHAGGRMKAYVTGGEAKKNKELAGGTHYISGSVATHRLTQTGELKRTNRFPLLAFVKDFPRVAKLVYKLFRQ